MKGTRNILAFLAAVCWIGVSSFQLPRTARRLKFSVADFLAPPPYATLAESPPSSVSCLFSSIGPSGNPPSRTRDKVRALMTNVSNSLLRLKEKLDAKMMAALLIFAWLFGSMSVDAISGAATRYAASQPQTEKVAFSKFMDHCEGKYPSEYVSNVKVDTATDRLEYQILRPESKSQRRLLKTIRSGDKTLNLGDMPAAIAHTNLLMDKSELIQFLRKHCIPFESKEVVNTKKSEEGGLVTAAILFAAYKLYNNQNASFSKGSPGKRVDKKTKSGQSVSFDDIQGIDAAKHDVMELVDTLRNPEKYSLVGARAPTGILLEGPPGCGKTTLARATAALADVPLIHCSGSDFVEMYVGKGAARVRKLFTQARAIKGSCLIFIDEIDAIGKSRRGGGGGSGSSDEAEQTLNALLTCMDGLDSSDSTICVLAATNRLELLDPALVRPGRFDRLVKVDLPSMKGREQILRAHATKLPGFREASNIDPERSGSLGIGKAVDLSAVAAVTDGCSGADLEFITNEAAIRAVRRVSDQLNSGLEKSAIDTSIYPQDFEDSVESFFKSRTETKKKTGGILGGTKLPLL